VTGPSQLITARAFEEVFALSLRHEIEFVHLNLSVWLDAALGPALLSQDHFAGAQAFRAATSRIDFICPDYTGIPFAPLIAAQRNRSSSPVRFLIIAHAPAVYALEWALLRPLLRPGDLIVAPTQSARGAIEILCPDVSEFVRVAPHPIPRLPHDSVRCRRRYIASLTRIHPTKLLHRQIQAAAVLRDRGVRNVTMRLAGPLTDPDGHLPLSYARSLAAMIRRLGLQSCVDLVGPITDRVAKGRFLSEASAVLNLSVSLEESFGKTIAEALGCGVPVLGTRWDGLTETIGSGGRTLPVNCSEFGMDLAPETIADAVQALLGDPPADDVCRTQADKSDPMRICSRYRELLEEAMAADPASAIDDSNLTSGLSAAPTRGLLGATAPLTQLSWDEMFALYLQNITKQRSALAAEQPPEPEDLRTLIIAGIRWPMERYFAGWTDSIIALPPCIPTTASGTDFLDSVAKAASGEATRSSLLACLHALAMRGRYAELDAGLQRLPADMFRHWSVRFLQIEALRQRGEFGKAFALCVEPQDPFYWSELAAPRLRQLARVCREWGFPGLALPWLREWLDRFPDSPDSSGVWLDRSCNALGIGMSAEARSSLNTVRALIGSAVDLAALENCVANFEATASEIQREATASVEKSPRVS
jgi:glycosyltransferase involved in cell wall biosynthesis